jgi:hypothetical protein
MPVKSDALLVDAGTRFRIFPHPRFLKSFSQPETVCVNAPSNIRLQGPADDRLFVVDAVNKVPLVRQTSITSGIAGERANAVLRRN